MRKMTMYGFSSQALPYMLFYRFVLRRDRLLTERGDWFGRVTPRTTGTPIIVHWAARRSMAVAWRAAGRSSFIALVAARSLCDTDWRVR